MSGTRLHSPRGLGSNWDLELEPLRLLNGLQTDPPPRRSPKVSVFTLHVRKPGPRESGGRKKKEKGKPSQEALEPGPDPRMVAPGRRPETSCPALLEHSAHPCIMGVRAPCLQHYLGTAGNLKEWGHPHPLRSPHPVRHRGGLQEVPSKQGPSGTYRRDWKARS